MSLLNLVSIEDTQQDWLNSPILTKSLYTNYLV